MWTAEGKIIETSFMMHSAKKFIVTQQVKRALWNPESSLLLLHKLGL
jgi:hypothetical protein